MSRIIVRKLLKTIKNVPLRRHIVTSASVEKLTRSYCANISDSPLCPLTMGQALDYTEGKFGDSEAFVFLHQGIRRTFTQYKNDVDRFAAGLLSLGLKKGEKVAIWAPNSYEWVVAQSAAAKAGVVFVAMNAGYQAREVEYCLELADVKCLIIGETLKTQDYHKILTAILPEIEITKAEALKSKRFPLLKSVISLSREPQSGTFSFSQIQDGAGSEHTKQLHEMQAHIDFDDPLTIIFTSGTTGRPKCATNSHFNVVNGVGYVGGNIGYRANHTVAMLTVPLFHIFGAVMGTAAAVVHGIKVVSPAPAYHVPSILKAAQEEKCTVMYGTPTMMMDMANYPELKSFDLSSLESAVCGGALCPADVIRISKKNLNLKEFFLGYGSTECAVTTMTRIDDIEKYKETTVGRGIQATEIKVVSSKNTVVPVNEVGEVCVRGYGTFLGYYNELEKTKAVKTETGWYHTGDFGVMNEDGYLTIIGRKDDTIIRGGTKIFPKEVEDVLFKHPDILHAEVVGVPDQRLGEKVAAWIKLKPGITLTKEDIKKFLIPQMLKHKVPEVIQFVDSYPMTPLGKVQKFKLREQYKNNNKTNTGINDI